MSEIGICLLMSAGCTKIVGCIIDPTRPPMLRKPISVFAPGRGLERLCMTSGIDIPPEPLRFREFKRLDNGIYEEVSDHRQEEEANDDSV